MKIHGSRYSPGAIIRIGTPNEEEDQGFQYGRIDDIIVFKDHKIFRTTTLKLVGIDEHLRALRVKESNEQLLVLYEHLFSHTVLHVKAKLGITYIIDTDYYALYF